MKKPQPPEHLEAPGKNFFVKMVTDHDIQDFTGRELVARAVEAVDRMAQARQAIAKNGLVVPNRYGNLVVNPALRIEREAHRAFLSALRLLDKMTP